MWATNDKERTVWERAVRILRQNSVATITTTTTVAVDVPRVEQMLNRAEAGTSQKKQGQGPFRQQTMLLIRTAKGRVDTFGVTKEVKMRFLIPSGRIIAYHLP